MITILLNVFKAIVWLVNLLRALGVMAIRPFQPKPKHPAKKK